MVKSRLQSISDLQCVRVGIMVLGGKVFGGLYLKFICDIICHIVGDND